MNVLRLLAIVASLVVTPFAAHAQTADPSGDWRVTQASGGRLALHLGETSTFDSIDQGQMGVAARMSVEGQRVTVVIGQTGNARFEGELSADGQRLAGMFTAATNAPQPLTFERGVFAPFESTLETQAVSGDWRGTLAVNGINLRLVFHLGAASRLDSIDQGANGIIAQLAVAGKRVTVNVPRIGGVFEGDLSQDGAQLVGEWRQAAQRWPLSLERGAFGPANRPQTPVAPFPYRAEEVEYDNAQRPGVHLAGTLTVPEGRGPFPAVLLITGSGAQDRDEALMGHQPFLILADYLSRRGFAVLRVDDRGVGGSRGATANDTMHDYVTDVEAGIALLKSRRDIDRRRIALIGHSEGGLIAPVVASHDPSLAGIVLWAGPGVRGADVMVEQVRAVMLSSGAPAEQAEASAQAQRQVMDALLAAPDAEAARAAVASAMSAAGAPAPAPAQLNLVTSPWFRTFIAYDPAPTLRDLRVPVLALLGGKDVQVVATQNEPALRDALSGNRRARVTVLPGLNHLFQTATTGAVAEYAQIEETIAPEALAAMGDWLTETLQPRRRR